ncbi:DM13 domain-containing protein [Pedobacter roseus]|uniref:Uncharacterized protein n=1 Tax=Pedobacter roseus TaxID=336820 RepID=A0A7G9QHS7_9SPHI|nr:DM13 domain-containing protein [Pedobacter roseus]QNN42902.1 hypothetical protein H9L23_01970 [Pedobacter roseus]
MRHFIYWSAVIAFTISFASCKKETTPTMVLNEKVDTAAAKLVTGSSDFSNGSYGQVTGAARIYVTNGKYQLALENFASSNGPDLKVYISKEQQPFNFVNLGSLYSTQKSRCVLSERFDVQCFISNSVSHFNFSFYSPNHSPELCEFMHILWGAGNEKSLLSYDLQAFVGF